MKIYTIGKSPPDTLLPFLNAIAELLATQVLLDMKKEIKDAKESLER